MVFTKFLNQFSSERIKSHQKKSFLIVNKTHFAFLTESSSILLFWMSDIVQKY